MNIKRRGAFFAAVILAMLTVARPARAGNDGLLDQLGSDFKYTVNSVAGDAEDIVTAPFHFTPQTLTNPKVYFTLLGAGAALGGAFALDNTIRSHIRAMPNGTANALESAGTYSLAAGAGLLYVAGLATDNDRARHYMLTTGEAVAAAEVVTIAFKYGFGRARPRDGRGSWAFWKQGESFISGETTPVFALAAGISEYYENRWWVALPCYSAAVAVGLGRMGHDAHWFSDVVGSGLVGVGTTELLLYLHKRREENPGHHYWVFPIATPSGGGVGAGFDW